MNKFKAGERYTARTNADRDALLAEMETDGIRWMSGCKPTKWGGTYNAPLNIMISSLREIVQSCDPEDIASGILYEKNPKERHPDITIERHGRKTIAKCNGTAVSVSRFYKDEEDAETGAIEAVKKLFSVMNKNKVPEVREVERKAKVGEWIKIVDPAFVPIEADGNPSYKKGDVLKVIDVDCSCARFKECCDISGRQFVVHHREYVVLENYKPADVEKKPKYFNGKVVCTSSVDTGLTKGKVYEFKGGISKWNSGNKLPDVWQREPFKDISDLCSWTGCKFIPFVESEEK